MGPERGSRLPPEVYKYSGLGCTFSAAVVLFTLGGWWLDDRFGTVPVFTLVGALVGTTLALLNIWQRFQPDRPKPRDPDDR